MEKFKFHLQNYFNVTVPVPALIFAILYMLVTLLWSVILISVVDPQYLEGVFEGETGRFDLSLRVFMLTYEIALIPLYLKRLLDMGWHGKQRDMALIGLLLAPVLSTVLSDGGFELVTSSLVFLRILALIVTFALFFTPTKQK